MSILKIKTLFMAVLLVGMCVSWGQGHAASWQVKESTTRIRFNVMSRRMPYGNVPVPVELAAEVKGVRALDDKGKELEISPLFIDGRLVSVFVNASKSGGGNQQDFQHANASLYLLDKEEGGATSPVAFPAPVRLQRQVQTLTSRAFTAEEMMRLFANLRQRRAAFPPVNVAGFGDVFNRPNWQQPPESTYACAAMHWDALWKQDKAESIRFGADQSHVAWTVLLDGKPVANWQGEKLLQRNGGGSFGEAVQVEAGMHTLEFLVVQCRQQPIPKLLVKKTEDVKDLGQAPKGLFPIQRPIVYGIQVKDQPDKSTRMAMVPDQSYYFCETDQTLAIYRQAGKEPFEVFPHGSSQSAPLLDNLHVCAGSDYPGVKLKAKAATYTIPGYPCWKRSQAAWFRGRLGTVTPLVRADSEIDGEILVEWPPFIPSALQPLLAIEARQLDAQGKVLASEKLSGGNPQRYAFKVKPLTETSWIEFIPDLAGTCPFGAMRLKLHRPKDAVKAITAQGTSLFDSEDYQAARVVCVADILPEKAGSQGFPEQAASLALWDDFMSTANAPQANFHMEELLSDHLQHTKLTQILRAGVSCPTGTDEAITLLANLAPLLQCKSQLAVLAVGSKPLKAGLKPLQASEQLLFAAQACMAQGIVPILVTLPPLPGIDAEDMRLSALYVKELAVRLGAPCIDLYALSLKERIIPMQWFMADAIAIPTPNNAARIWFAQKIYGELERILKQHECL